MAEEAFELIRRVGGRRVQYQVRTTGGRFKTVEGATYEESLNLAEENIPVDVKDGTVDYDEYVEYEQEQNPFAQESEELPAGEGYEEVQLDEIEIDTSATPEAAAAESAGADLASGLTEGVTEATPLLGGAAAEGGAAGAAGVAAAGAAGAVIIGGTIASLASGDSDDDADEHIDPPITLPKHHYLGPGNTVDDIPPVDEDDHIARDHDIAYEHAKTQKDIQKADIDGANKFLTDVIENKNPHSALGYIGLKSKHLVESAVGVKYPSGLPTGMGRDDKTPRGKYPIHHDPTSQSHFPTDRNRQRYVWDAWNRARQAQGLPRVDPPTNLNIGVTFRPPMRGGVRPPSASISYRTWRESVRPSTSGPLVDAFNRQRTLNVLQQGVAESLNEDERMEIEDIVRFLDKGGSISIADFDDADGAGPSHAPDDMGGGTKRGGGEQGGSARPQQPVPVGAPAVAAGAGHNSSSDGGFDSAQGPEKFLPSGGYQSSAGALMFKKVHRLKSWAIPYLNVTDPTTRSGANLVTTPLAKIPWEYAFFYLSPDDFDLIPAGSFVEAVTIKVMQTVATTGFATGGTTATTATTNHPKVLCIGKDLEKTMRGGVDRGLDIDNDMKPSLKTNASPSEIYKDFIEKQYGTDQTANDGTVVVPGCAHKIPWYNQNHFCVYQPNRAQALARGFFVEAEGAVTENRAPGFEYFQNCITECNANDTTWDHVDVMHYEFTSAPIGEQYRQLEILTDNFNQSVGNAQYYNAKRNVTNATVGGDTTLTETIVPSTRNTLPIVTYSSAPIEQGSHYVRGDSANKPSRQPTYHIGMRAIDKTSPMDGTSRADKFVQANIEFEIEAIMTVKLPSYPNRFVRPKFYQTSMENAVMGIGTYPAYGDERFATFGLLNDSATKPAVAAVDQIDREPTEDDMVTVPRRNRPRRTLPSVPTRVKRKRTTATQL